VGSTSGHTEAPSITDVILSQGAYELRHEADIPVLAGRQIDVAKPTLASLRWRPAENVSHSQTLNTNPRLEYSSWSYRVTSCRDPPPDSSWSYRVTSSAPMADGLSVWLVRRSGIPRRTACGIRLSAGTVSDNLWRRFCSQRTDAFSALEVSRRCAIYYLLTFTLIRGNCTRMSENNDKSSWFWRCRRASHLCTWRPSTGTCAPLDCCSREVLIQTSKVETVWRRCTSPHITATSPSRWCWWRTERRRAVWRRYRALTFYSFTPLNHRATDRLLNHRAVMHFVISVSFSLIRSFCHSVRVQDYCKSNHLISLKVDVTIWLLIGITD